MAPLAWLRGQNLLVHISCSQSAYSSCGEPSGHWLSALCPSTKCHFTIVLSHKLTKLNASKIRVIDWSPLHIKAWPLSTASLQSLFPKFSDFTSSWRSREASSSKSISYPAKQVTVLISRGSQRPFLKTLSLHWWPQASQEETPRSEVYAPASKVPPILYLLPTSSVPLEPHPLTSLTFELY